MNEWHKQIQIILDEIDECIKNRDDEALTLQVLSGKLGYSEYHTTRKFKEISGMQFRDYRRLRKLAFALIEVRDARKGILDIAFDYGFSSHEAFTRAFKAAYGVTPSEYRRKPVPVVLRTKINLFDRYFLGIGEIGMVKSTENVKIYLVTIPAHKYMHIISYDTRGYWDFWKKHDAIPGYDCETICKKLADMGGNLDDLGGSGPNAGNGQLMAYHNDPKGKTDVGCWMGSGPLAESYGIRLDSNYGGAVPQPFLMLDVPEAEYIVFEHGPFDFEQENHKVEERIEKAIMAFDSAGSDYRYDDTTGRLTYLYHDPERFWKWVRPVKMS